MKTQREVEHQAAPEKTKDKRVGNAPDVERCWQAPSAPACYVAAVALTEQRDKAFQTLQKCVIALRLRGDPIANDIYDAMCILTYCVVQTAEPP